MGSLNNTENTNTGMRYIMTVFQFPFPERTMVEIGFATAKYRPSATTIVAYIDATIMILCKGLKNTGNRYKCRVWYGGGLAQTFIFG